MKNAGSTTPRTAKQKRSIFIGPWHRIYPPGALLDWFCVQYWMANSYVAYTLARNTYCIYRLHNHIQGALRWLWTFDVHSYHPCRWFHWVYYHYQPSKWLTSFTSKNQE
jgi:hypothetical protein